jgi:phosphotriesterase-related protein
MDKVQTVLGPIAADSLGVTLTHEHLVTDLGMYFIEPEEASDRGHSHAPVGIELLDRVRGAWRFNLDNLHLWDFDAALEQIRLYQRAGGNAVVDAGSIGLGRDPLALARMSRAAGLHIIMGASYYVRLSHPPDMDGRSEDDIAAEIIRDVTVGVGETGIRSGIIGEVGCWWPLGGNERKVLRASARAQRETGVPILIHPGSHEDAHMEILEVLSDAGADLSHVIMGHLDSLLNDLDVMRKVAGTGCFMEYDGFGKENSGNPLAAYDLVNDVGRMDKIRFLIDEGHLSQIVIAHDVCVKTHHTSYGGMGFAHILDNIVPRMRRRGFTAEEIQAILVGNPRRALTIRSPR